MVVPVELKRKYLSRRTQDLIQLKESLKQNDYSFALKLGHQVKGNAKTFELQEMAPLGMELELAARRKDKETLFFVVQKLETAISVAQSVFHPAPERED